MVFYTYWVRLGLFDMTKPFYSFTARYRYCSINKSMVSNDHSVISKLQKLKTVKLYQYLKTQAVGFLRGTSEPKESSPNCPCRVSERIRKLRGTMTTWESAALYLWLSVYLTGEGIWCNSRRSVHQQLVFIVQNKEWNHTFISITLILHFVPLTEPEREEAEDECRAPTLYLNSCLMISYHYVPDSDGAAPPPRI